ncbi:N4-gp56 family major capsid protein (plasmid) [Brucella pseudintermedia]|uniref:N4-gp56 family major capsid protein n=1 Tax=Brucella pseudintermedia TaxID=370111 RepID=UPI002AC90834|nr:N4-gp56 family major capsid protein [Brucella pseudintermedia]WPM83087.1 N4-gp56 family major capsid protein [Brucella pseudintermedia]
MAAKTTIPFGSPLAVARWSGALFASVETQSYWARKFMGEDDNAIIQRLTDLEKEAGDTIHFDLSAQLRQKPTPGDNRIEGKEEQLRFYSDEVKIDQLRHPVSAGGKMSRKRTAHDLRKTAKARLSEYWAKYMDEINFIYVSGARGMNEDFTEEVTYTGHATNPIQAPDNDHILYGGDAESKATISSTSKMDRDLIERAVVHAGMMRSLNPDNANMQPVTINGESHYVCVMSLFQEYDLRTSDTAGWLEIQKAAAAAEGRNNPIFKGGLGMINNCVLHSHQRVIRFDDYGADGKQPAARALFMGRQAGVVAYGSTGGMRFTWKEEMRDYDNEPTVAAGIIFGVKKTRFNDRDYGVVALDTYASRPKKK